MKNTYTKQNNNNKHQTSKLYKKNEIDNELNTEAGASQINLILWDRTTIIECVSLLHTNR